MTDPHAPRRRRAVWLMASAVAFAVIPEAAAAQARNGTTARGDGTADSSPHHGISRPKLRDGVLRVDGSNAADVIALRLASGQPGLLEVDLGDDGSPDFSFDRAAITRITVRAESGNDSVRIDERNGVFTDAIATTISGGRDDDNLAGGSGDEILDGGRGNDSIDGNRGADIGFMGDGDDSFTWDPGDGSDIVEGQRGHDTMVFNGAGVAETVDLSANGHRLTFFRNPGSVTMDTDDVERADFNALGGADAVSVNDLSGTDVDDVRIDLAAALGGQTGDGAPDSVVVNATNGDDDVTVAGNASGVSVRGLAATTEILHSQAADDRLEVNTLDGSDRVDSGGLTAGLIQLVVDGAPTP